jgi:hypothetical protein
MATKFQTKITKSRFVYSPLSGQRMAEIGQTLIDTIFERWDRGMGVDDSPAKPLTQKSATRKQRQGGSALRDLKRSGQLRRAIQVLGSTYNEFSIGPASGMHTRLKRGGQFSFVEVLAVNDHRSPMWGVSPSDHFRMKQLVAESRPVKATEMEKVA